MEIIKPKFNRTDFPCGVYRITFNDRWFYIGSTYNLKKRFVRWKTSLTKPHFFQCRRIKELLPEIYKAEIVVLKICDDYETQEQVFINQYWGSPELLNERRQYGVFRRRRKTTLTLQQAEQMREIRGMSVREIAVKYNVSYNTAYAIVNNITYKIKKPA